MSQLDPDRNLYIAHMQNETLDKLRSGDIEDVVCAIKWPADAIVHYAFEEGYIKEGLNSFPDPRHASTVPIDAMLLSHVMRSLNQEHSLLSAPYMLNDAVLMTQLGYNVRVFNEGFNDSNIHKRETAFNGDTLRHILKHLKPNQIIDWFNDKWGPLLKQQAPGRTHQYVLDGTYVPVPAHLADKFQDCGVVKDQSGEVTYGYKICFLYEVIDRKGVLLAMKLAPINVHDIVLGKELVSDFEFEKEAMLIMDRGFIDGAWITELKLQRQIDVCLPLRRNMEITQAAVVIANNRATWQPHPTRKHQQIFEIKSPDLFWEECKVLRSGVLVRWQKDDGSNDEVLFVTTKHNMSGKRLLETYDLRVEIEESHRQLKCFQGIEKLPSKKLCDIAFRLVTGVIGYNLFNLFLNSESCASLEEYSLKTLRQKRKLNKYDTKIIIYAKSTFAVLGFLDFFALILDLRKGAGQKLSRLIKSLNMEMASP